MSEPLQGLAAARNAKQRRRGLKGVAAARAHAKAERATQGGNNRELSVLADSGRLPTSTGLHIVVRDKRSRVVEVKEPSTGNFRLTQLRMHAPQGRIHMVETLGISIDASPAQLCHVLHHLSGSIMMKTCRVLVLAGLAAFDDSCMEQLLILMRHNPHLLSLNLGEKPRVTYHAWCALASALHHPASRIVGMFVDIVDAGAEIVKLVQHALTSSRKRLESMAREASAKGDRAGGILLVPWRSELVWKDGCVLDDWWWGKPFYHPKWGWEELGADRYYVDREVKGMRVRFLVQIRNGSKREKRVTQPNLMCS